MTILVSATNAVELLVMKYVFDHLAEGGLVQALAAGVTGLVGLALLRELGFLLSDFCRDCHAAAGLAHDSAGAGLHATAGADRRPGGTNANNPRAHSHGQLGADIFALQ